MSKKKEAKKVIAFKAGIEVPCGPKEYYDWAKEYVEIIGKNVATLKMRLYTIVNYHIPKCTMDILDPDDKTGKKTITVPDRQLLASYQKMINDNELQIAEFNYIYGLALEKIKEYEELNPSIVAKTASS